ncbi:MAG: type II secretion system protein [Polaromonas sp.]|nr:type II secretion system protein [Polaromonas sp.]MDP3752129.1 type II secretion system protein [Polaromonas sp.]
MRGLTGKRGFTLIELLVALAIVALLATVALPLAQVVQWRTKESELKTNLRVIRQALDTYKAAADAGIIDKGAGTSGYPPTLDTLAEGVQRSAALGYSAQAFVVLRKVPRDPFFEDSSVPNAATWQTRSYSSKADNPQPGDDVFDVSSKSSKQAIDGTRYSDW